MEKKCKVVLLPTDLGSKLHKNNLGNYYITKGKENSVVSNDVFIYVLSDDEIKEGDWFYDGESLLKASRITDIIIDTQGMWSKFESSRKVIATNNPDLIKEGIASIDDEFIREYVKNPVEQVLVEYENKYKEECDCYKADITDGCDNPNHHVIIQKYKLSSNGSIITKPHKADALEETWDDIFYKKFSEAYPRYGDKFDLLRWLKENYEAPKNKQ